MPVANKSVLSEPGGTGTTPPTPLAASIIRMWTGDLREPREIHTIEGLREELAEARKASRRNTYVLRVCKAPTGSGKSYADIEVIKELERQGVKSVILVPDHKNAQEVAAKLRSEGIPSVAYPHLCADNCARWDESGAVLDLGLSAAATLCRTCEHRHGCPYYTEYQEASACNHRVATQARGRVSLPVLARECGYLSIHEDPLDFLAPVVSLDETYRKEGQRLIVDKDHPLQVVARIAEQAERDATDPNDRSFYRHLARIALVLDREHHAAFEMVDVTPHTGFRHEPKELHADLYNAACVCGLVHPPPREAMQLALAAALSKLRRLVVLVNEVRGEGGEVRRYNTLLGVEKMDLPPGMAIILNDATADEEEIQAVSERPTQDITPRGTVPLLHPVVQICPTYDIIRDRNIDHAADILRGILHDLPYRRVGMLTHSTLHEKVRAALGEPYASWIAMEAYFGDGLSRGSNEWIEECDALIVFGTPRPGTKAIRQRMVQTLKVRSAMLTEEKADWHRVKWTGTTESGETVEVETGRYRDDDWHRAYCNTAKAQLKQAIGRGRGILPEGIPVYVVSTEDIGSGSILTPQTGRTLVPAHHHLPLKRDCVDVLRVLAEAGATAGSQAIKTGQICRTLFGRTDSASLEWVKYRLGLLLDAERVRRKGSRKGWYIPLTG